MRRGRIVLVVIALIVVWALFFVFFIRPRQGELTQVREEIVAAQQQTTQLETELARLQELQANAPELEAQLATIRQFVPEQNQVPNYIFLVQDAANRAGVGFLQITPELPKPPPEGAALAEVRMTIAASGGYFAIQDFTRRLEDLDRASRVDQVGLTGTTNAATGVTSVGLTLTVRIFFELPEAAIVPGATPTPAPVEGG